MSALKVSPLNKIAYGFGSVAFGIKGNGFDYFFLLFYSQVMGVDAYLVGLGAVNLPDGRCLLATRSLAISPITRTIDGVADIRSCMPAAIPVAVAYFFVWNPPASLSRQ